MRKSQRSGARNLAKAAAGPDDRDVPVETPPLQASKSEQRVMAVRPWGSDRVWEETPLRLHPKAEGGAGTLKTDPLETQPHVEHKVKLQELKPRVARVTRAATEPERNATPPRLTRFPH